MKSSVLEVMRSPTLEQADETYEHVFGSKCRDMDSALQSEYFDFLQGEFSGLRYGICAGILRETSLAIETFEDLITEMHKLRESLSVPLFKIRASLRQELRQQRLIS